MTTQENYNRWLNSPRVSEKDKETLRSMSQKDIDDAFFKDVEFGTAGMRGVLGPGTNRMNDFTVRKATVAFAYYLLELFPNKPPDWLTLLFPNKKFPELLFEKLLLLLLLLRLLLLLLNKLPLLLLLLLKPNNPELL